MSPPISIWVNAICSTVRPCPSLSWDFSGIAVSLSSQSRYP